MLLFKKGGLKMVDFPGGMKPIMPAWKPGERCEEGLKINEELLIEEWYKECSLTGKVMESWKKNGYQFFISTYEPKQFVFMVFMGVLCSKNDDGFLKIAKKVEENYNRKIIDKFPCFSEICVKIVTTGNNKDIAFLFQIKRVIYKRNLNKDIEEELMEAVRDFEKEKAKYA